MFRYEAADARGNVQRGAMEAPSATEVRQRLEGRGYQQVQVLPTRDASQTVRIAEPDVATQAAGGFRHSAPAQDRALFFRQMASLANAGFTPGASLDNLGPRTSHPGLRDAALQMGRRVNAGGALAAAMAEQGGLFPEQAVGVVAAGEQGGFLPFAFEEAALDAEHDQALRQGLGWAKFLIWQSVWSVLLFLPLFPSIDTENAARSIGNYTRALLLGVVPVGIGLHVGALALGRWWATPAGVGFRDQLMLRVPPMARLARARALAAFTRVLRRLLSAGIAPEAAFAAAARSVPNSLLREQLLRGLPVLRSAGGIDAAIRAGGLMDHDPLQLLVTGQQTGTWTATLDQVAAFYQEEAARATDAVRSFQKRLGIILTLVTSGYVTIAATAGGMRLMNGFLRTFEGP